MVTAVAAVVVVVVAGAVAAAEAMAGAAAGHLGKAQALGVLLRMFITRLLPEQTKMRRHSSSTLS